MISPRNDEVGRWDEDRLGWRRMGGRVEGKGGVPRVEGGEGWVRGE